MNQISGLSLSNELETLRILLFKFGGEESNWTREAIQACDTYFRHFAARTVINEPRKRKLVAVDQRVSLKPFRP